MQSSTNSTNSTLNDDIDDHYFQLFKVKWRKLIKMMNLSQDIIRVDEANLDSKLSELYDFHRNLTQDDTQVFSYAESVSVTLEDLNRATGFDWRDFLEKLIKKSGNKFNRRLDIETKVRVAHFSILNKILYQLNNASEDLLKSYVSMKVLQEFGSYVSERLRELFEGMSLTPGFEGKTTRKKFCLNMFMKEFEFIASRIMIKKNFPKEDKEETTEMITEIYHALYSNIIDIDWLDDTTRTRALKKLELMKIVVGHLDWYMVDRKIDEYYGLTSDAIYQRLTKTTNYVRSMMEFKRLEKKNQIRRFLERQNEVHK